jgi:hypothetical protein
MAEIKTPELSSSDLTRKPNQTLLDLGEKFSALIQPLQAILDHLIENNKIAARGARLTTFVLWGLLTCFVLAAVVLIRVENATSRLIKAQESEERLARRIEDSIRITNVVAQTTKDTQKTVVAVQDEAASQPSVVVLPGVAKDELKVVIQPRRKVHVPELVAMQSDSVTVSASDSAPVSAPMAIEEKAVEIPVKADSELGRQLSGLKR